MFSQGPKQFAYRPRRGCRNVLACLILEFLIGFAQGLKFAFYSADVSSAFDRVSRGRFLYKLRAKGLEERFLCVVAAWLDARIASVRVDGALSTNFTLRDMVFQGTALRPTLWTFFYEDVNVPVKSQGFTEIVYADDSNIFVRSFDVSTPDDVVVAACDRFHEEVYLWSQVN